MSEYRLSFWFYQLLRKCYANEYEKRSPYTDTGSSWMKGRGGYLRNLPSTVINMHNLFLYHLYWVSASLSLSLTTLITSVCKSIIFYCWYIYQQIYFPSCCTLTLESPREQSTPRLSSKTKQKNRNRTCFWKWMHIWELLHATYVWDPLQLYYLTHSV